MNAIEKIVLFHNPTDEDFTGMWNKVSEVIKAQGSRHMELWRANHYAKHLIDRELNKLGVVTNNQVEREKLYKTIVIDEEVIEVAKDSVAEELANIPKKKVTKKAKTSDEEEFADLKE